MNQASGTRASRKVRVGVVVSDQMDRTVVVQLERRLAHPLYGKQIKRTRRVKVHDEQGAHIGDKVKIMEMRPLSKTKRWRVVEIVRRAK